MEETFRVERVLHDAVVGALVAVDGFSAMTWFRVKGLGFRVYGVGLRVRSSATLGFSE